MKRIKIALILLAGIIILFTYMQCSTESYTGRWVIWNKSDIEDYLKFPNYSFNASSKPFYFHSKLDSTYDSLHVSEKKNKKTPLSQILEKSLTTAFLIIRNDTILYEKYLNGYDNQSINTSFSTAKSITSLLVGTAIDDGFITSENDKVTDYLPELLQIDPGYSNLELSHLLDMRSGIQ